MRLPDCMICQRSELEDPKIIRDMLWLPGERERSGEHLSSKGHAGTGANGSRPKTAGEGYGGLMAAYGGFMAGYGGFMEGPLFEEIWMMTISYSRSCQR